ncbi:MAG: zf-HC2 domain-containing protein [Burkholderiales bacterium]|nr:zf-HC2 domain-containing protein [Burkholderiales bacterium]
MTSSTQPDCPRTEQLAALIDDELAPDAREQVTSHAAACPLCGAMLRDLAGLHAALQPFTAARVGFDLAPLVEQRLAASGQRQQRGREPRWWQGWRLAPSGLTAAGMLTVGVYLGALLAGGAGVAVARPAAMAVFDPIPPGGICVGLQSCYPQR